MKLRETVPARGPAPVAAAVPGTKPDVGRSSGTKPDVVPSSGAMPADVFEVPQPVPTAGVPDRWPARVPGPIRGLLVRLGTAAKSVKDLVSGWFTRDSKPPEAATPAQRAAATWQAAEDRLKIAGRGLFADNSGNPFHVAAVWPHGQAIAAALDLAGVSGDFGPLSDVPGMSDTKADRRRLDVAYRRVDDLMAGLSYYKRQGAYSGGIDEFGDAPKYYDDNAWIALDFLQAHAQTGNRDYLRNAEELFKFLERGQHPEGGVHWVEKADRMSRNTCSTAPAIEVALRLYLATRDQTYLAFAKRQDEFLNSRLRSPEGLYWDNLGDDGSLDKAIYSYNQGTPIGSDVLFYRITGDRKYLERARQTADAALSYFGQEDRLWKSSPAFNAIFFRNLLALDQVAPDPRYRATMASYLDRTWREARDPETGLYTRGGIGAYGKPGNLLDQSGLAQMQALLAWPPERLLDAS